MKLAKLIQLAAFTTERVNDPHGAKTRCAGGSRRGAHWTPFAGHQIVLNGGAVPVKATPLRGRLMPSIDSHRITAQNQHLPARDRCGDTVAEDQAIPQ
jgi:hypothetical protein